MGLAYYRIPTGTYETLRSLIEAHEAELVGPRARGYWFERPSDYDYEQVRATAQHLDKVGKAEATEQLELSEVQAHSLSLLDVELPADNRELSPALFMTSGTSDTISRYLKIARRKLGSDPDEVLSHLDVRERDPRFSGYLTKQLRHLREALPLVWHFHERAVEVGEAILVVDLRARDLEIPDEIELADVY